LHLAVCTGSRSSPLSAARAASVASIRVSR
jgi:hypothetical protein